MCRGVERDAPDDERKRPGIEISGKVLHRCQETGVVFLCVRDGRLMGSESSVLVMVEVNSQTRRSSGPETREVKFTHSWNSLKIFGRTSIFSDVSEAFRRSVWLVAVRIQNMRNLAQELDLENPHVAHEQRVAGKCMSSQSRYLETHDERSRARSYLPSIHPERC
jgi:hypothetical protein